MIPLRQFHSEFISAGWVPHPCRSAKGGVFSGSSDAEGSLSAATGSIICISSPAAAIGACLFSAPPRARDLFLKILDETRSRYHFELVGLRGDARAHPYPDQRTEDRHTVRQ